MEKRYACRGSRAEEDATRRVRIESAFKDKLWRCFYLLCTVFLLGSLSTLKAQVGGAAKKANFGVEGDVYSNLLQFGGLSGATGSDDWFRNTTAYPGTGLGVIDTSGGAAFRAALLAASNSTGRNKTFVRHMSASKNTVNNGTLWIDAIYARDNVAVQAAFDSSTFTGSSNKNGDDPSTWSLQVDGVPQKDDLVDAFAHLRRAGSNATDSLFLFVGSTTISTDGNSHSDFEFYKKTLTYTPGVGISGFGSDAGHSAWTFNADGSFNATGDLLFAVDFENGGTTPKASVRIWVDPSALPGGSFTAYNLLAGRPFNFSGVFNGGNGSGVFGYAEIVPKTGTLLSGVNAKVNVEEVTLGAPWGSLEGSSASFSNNIQQRGLAEASINLTKLGLDGGSNTCVNLFGTIMFKTRSSSSFTAELKDFSGPFDFGFTREVTYALTQTNITCAANGTTSVINVSPATVDIQWSGAGLVSGGTSTTATWNQPGMKIATVTIVGTVCSKIDSIQLMIDTVPPAITCSNDGPLTCTNTSVDLSANNCASDTSVSYSWSGPGGYTSSSQCPTGITIPGNYIVQITKHSNGCTAVCTTSVAIDTVAPVITCSNDGPLTCTNTSVDLRANNCISDTSVSYSWSGPGGYTSSSQCPTGITVPGNYIVQITKHSNGCTAVCTTSVAIDTIAPVITCSNDGPLTCTNTSVDLTANGCTADTSVSYSWSGPGGYTSNVQCPAGVTVPGDYIVQITKNSNGCTAVCTTSVAIDTIAPVITCSNDGPLTCTNTSVDLSANGCTADTSVSYSWSGPGGYTSNVQCPAGVTVPGDYIVQITKNSNGCTEVCTTSVAIDTVSLVITCSNDGPLTCTDTSVDLTANGCTADTSVSYSWSGPGGYTSNVQCPAGVTASGDYIVQITKNSNGCTAVCTTSVAIDTASVPCSISMGLDPVFCNTTGYTASTGAVGVSYEWSVIPNQAVSGWSIASGQGTNSITFDAGDCGTAGFMVTLQLVTTNQNGCKDTCYLTFTPAVMVTDEACTLTQGFYGNSGGTSCATGLRTLPLIQLLLSTDLVVGKPGRSLTITEGDAQCVIKRLPANGGSSLLPSGNGTFNSNCTTTPAIQLKQGKFHNVLLGQTITLGLNLRLDHGLGAIVITDNVLVTMEADPNGDGICGTEDDLPVSGMLVNKFIPQSVIDAMNSLYGTASITNLFDLSNRALGGMSTSGASLSDINQAVSSINEGFDHCRFLVGFLPLSSSVKYSEDGASVEASVSETERSAVAAYPNPFVNNVSFEFSVSQNEKAVLEVFSANGSKVATIFEGNMTANQVYKVGFDSTELPSGLYFFRFTSGDDNVQIGKLVLTR